jgi:hypothetical protein
VPTVTWGLRALVLVAALALVASSSAGTATNYRRVVFVRIYGQGSVTSSPAGLRCPKDCRAFFLKDEHVKLVGHPAAGWKLVRWAGSCTSKQPACGFFLSDSHDCANGFCPIGAFGERVTFVRSRSST